MPINKKYRADFVPDSFLHVYNRSNNHEILFPSARNKRYFLQQVESRLTYLMEVYAWCLIPNHFHYLIKTRSVDDAYRYLSQLTTRDLTITEARFLNGEKSFADLVLKAWTGAFQSYAQVFNDAYGRKGNLFYSSLKREIIEDEAYLRRALVYIHTNPVKHGMIDDFREYEWSSWREYASPARTNIPKAEVYEIFGGRQAFLMAHEFKQSLLLRDDFFLL